jgi:cysteine synthase A
MHSQPVESVLDLIGNTPMIKLNRISKDIPADIWAKLEYYNPGCSVKDRIALKMIEEAERRGQINKDTIIIEPTSGNTGVAISMVCAIKGYKMVAVLPEAVSIERRMLVELFGGQVELIQCVAKEKGVTKDDMECVVERAKELASEYPNSFIPDQFTNEDNPLAHAETTCAEIIEQTEGNFNAFVAAAGTGGTFTGIARVLKDKYPNIKTIVVEPSSSAVMSGCDPGHHKIQGIGEGFIPEVMDVGLTDLIIKVSDKDAINTARQLWKMEGITSGISGGANVFASLQLGRDMEEGEKIVTIIADCGMKYLSTKEFLTGV